MPHRGALGEGANALFPIQMRQEINMNTFTVIVDTPQEEVTQAKEKLFIHGMPITYTVALLTPQQATYDELFSELSDRHTITLLIEGTSLIVNGSEIKPNRSLTDEEMVAYLTEQLFESSNKVEQLRRTVVLLEQDAEIISDDLLEEAVNRGWCQEYNQFCEEVNSKLSMLALQPQESEYEVEVEVQAEVNTRYTVFVTASSLESAQSMVDDDPDMFLDPAEVALAAAKRDGWDDVTVTSM
jgi:hypothetical protein